MIDSPVFKHMPLPHFCGDCEHLTNVSDEDRLVPCVLGGCFKTGNLVTTEKAACRDFEEYKGPVKLPNPF